MPIQQKHLFARITKVDAAKRTVSGIAMQEIVDRTNEKCLYEESKPFFIAWSSNQEKASGGKSKGNLRAMHTSKVAGIVTDLVCDDEIKAFLIETEIIADDEWALVEKGAYTGFSIGANFALDASGKKMKAIVDGVLEWVADPVEISLVDTPCVPTALFELKLADGHSQMRKFVSAAQTKSIYSVAQMASALGDIRYMMEDLQWEAEYENDGSQIPARLRDWMAEGATIFLDLAEEETSEFAQMITGQKAARADRVKQGGASCGCSCAGCSDCKPQKAAAAAETETMTPDQQKSFDEGIATLKSIAPTLEALKSVPESLKTIVANQATQDERLKAVEIGLGELAEFKEGLAELEKAFGETPVPAKTKAIAITREGDALQAEAIVAAPALGKSTSPTDNQGDRMAAFKSLHATGAQAGSGFAGDRGEFPRS